MLRFTCSTNLTERQSVIAKQLKENLTTEWVISTLVPIISQKSKVSIRMMDWLCTNYSKSRNVTYAFEDNGSRRVFNLHLEYKNTLECYGRRLFDPFRRGPRCFFNIQYDENKTQTFESTLGQLVFWKWAFDHKVLEYANEYSEDIEKDMNIAHHSRDLKKQDGDNKRTSLSKEPKTSTHVYNMGCTLVFDESESDSDDEST